MTEHEDLAQSQVEYYRARAPEYDEWFLRQGRYDRGPEFKAMWFHEVEQLRETLKDHGPRGDVLEFAAGTGLWTEQLVEQAAHVTALDVSPESLKLNEKRVGSERVTHVCADVFDWKPPRIFDGAFFGFWLSHIPPERFDRFWNLVRESLRPEGRVFFVDSCYEPTSTAADHRLEGEESVAVTRRLNDGREFRIVKVFYQPEALRDCLRDLGWSFEVAETEQFFLYGYGHPI